MNLGVVQGTVQGEECEISVMLNYRYPVTKSFEDCGPKVGAAFEEAGFRSVSLNHKAGLYMEPDSPLVSRLLGVYERCT